MTGSPAAAAGPVAACEGMAGAVARLEEYWAGRDVALVLPQLSGAVAKLIGELAACGATVRAVISAELPAPDAPPVPHVWAGPAHGFTGLSQRQFDAVLADPPAALTEWLAVRDPDRSWTVVGSTHTQVGEVCGYPVHGWRRPEWGQLEDKIHNESLWREAGVPSPPHVICAPDDPALAGRACALDDGFGVVLALDSSRGIHGAATGLRWIRSAGDLRAAVDWARGAANRVRVAPFVPGIPFSMLGMVLRDGVAVFNPIEIVTLLDVPRGRFLYCGTATCWRPDEATAGTLRRHARAIGTRLAVLGYRGIFGADGIVSPTGKVVLTELNPRHAAGLGVRAAWPQFPIYLFQRAAQEAVSGVFDLDPLVVERAFSDLVRAHPTVAVRVPRGGQRIQPGHSADRVGTASSVRLTVSTPDAVEQTVHYHLDGDGASLLGVAPPLPDGTVTPAAGALSGRIGAALRTPRDLPADSTLARSRAE